MENTKLTITLRADLAHTIKAYAAKEGKTTEDFIVSTLLQFKKERALRELRDIQEYGRQRAEELGIHTEEELFRYLES